MLQLCDSDQWELCMCFRMIHAALNGRAIALVQDNRTILGNVLVTIRTLDVQCHVCSQNFKKMLQLIGDYNHNTNPIIAATI